LKIAKRDLSLESESRGYVGWLQLIKYKVGIAIATIPTSGRSIEQCDLIQTQTLLKFQLKRFQVVQVVNLGVIEYGNAKRVGLAHIGKLDILGLSILTLSF